MAATQKELYEIRSDVADYDGGDLRGVEHSLDVTKLAAAHPQFRWRDRISTGDLYEAEQSRMLHFYCPKCAGSLRVESAKKELRYEPGGPMGGRLNIGEMRCTYPGCGWHVRVVENVAIDIT